MAAREQEPQQERGRVSATEGDQASGVGIQGPELRASNVALANGPLRRGKMAAAFARRAGCPRIAAATSSQTKALSIRNEGFEARRRQPSPGTAPVRAATSIWHMCRMIQRRKAPLLPVTSQQLLRWLMGGEAGSAGSTCSY